MLFEEMYSIAQNAAMQQNGRFGPGDTICVARTVSGRVVIGFSSTAFMNNMPMPVHAEVDLCNTLIKDGDTAVAEISLFSALGLQTLLPCMECMNRLMCLNPYNPGTMLVLPDKVVPVSQMGVLMQNPAPQPMGNAGAFQGMAPTGAGYPNMNRPHGYGGYSDQQSLSFDQLQANPVRNNPVVSRAVSTYAQSEAAEDTGYLKKRLSQVLSDEDPEIEPEPEQNKSKKGLFSKLFK